MPTLKYTYNKLPRSSTSEQVFRTDIRAYNMWRKIHLKTMKSISVQNEHQQVTITPTFHKSCMSSTFIVVATVGYGLPHLTHSLFAYTLDLWCFS